ncbi:MAG: YjjG family noncanonical pyrimidine nucleotidase [Clostridia bacterium]|nr:YjjG family noncanonical pyrimidine nucleotidase [Clostridia bacterium]
MYKAIFFDIDDTIFNFGRCSHRALKAACTICKLPYREETFSVFQSIDNQLWAQQKKGKISVSDVLKIRAEQITKELGRPEMSREFQSVFSENLSGQIETEPFAAEALDSLSQTVKLYAASNGVLQMQISRLKKVGLLQYFSELFVSDDVGYEKPDSRFFSECVRRSGLERKDILMVGDSLTADIAGAKCSQIDCCWYNPKGQKLPPEYTPDYIVKNLLQINDILNEKMEK